MKKLLIGFLLAPLLAWGQATPPPATQAQVNQGTLTFPYVSPATLAGWLGNTNGGSNQLNAATATTAKNLQFAGSSTNQILYSPIIGDPTATNSPPIASVIMGIGNAYANLDTSHQWVAMMGWDTNGNFTWGNQAAFLQSNTNLWFNRGAYNNLTLGNFSGQDLGKENYGTAWGNVILGNESAPDLHTGAENVIIGEDSMSGEDRASSQNVVVGSESLFGNVGTTTNNDADQNDVVVGFGSMQFIDQGATNVTAIGYNVGNNLAHRESYDTLIDSPGVVGESFAIHIGDDGNHTNTFIGGNIHGNGGGLTNIPPSGVPLQRQHFGIPTIGAMVTNTFDPILGPIVDEVTNQVAVSWLIDPVPFSRSGLTNLNADFWLFCTNAAPALSLGCTLQALTNGIGAPDGTFVIASNNIVASSTVGTNTIEVNCRFFIPYGILTNIADMTIQFTNFAPATNVFIMSRSALTNSP